MTDVTVSRIPEPTLLAWQRIRAAAAGGDAVRSLPGSLPYLNPEDKAPANVARNAAYRDRAVWLGATGGTLEGMLGMAFRVDPRATLPERLAHLLINADGAGVSLYQQSQQSVGNVLQVGRHGLLADYAGGVPRIQAYRGENIINWRYEMDGDESVLTMLVLRETVTRPQPGNEFAVEDVQRYRVYRCTRQRERDDRGVERRIVTSQLWEPDVIGGALVERAAVPVTGGGGLTLSGIPFVPIGSKTNDFAFDPAPLGPIAEINLAHFRNSADYEDMLFWLGQAQPYITGLSDTDRDFLMAPYTVDPNTGARTPQQRMYWGSRAPMLLPQAATVGFAQLSPNDAQRQAMQDKEGQMRALGARLIDSAGNKTATGEDNDREASTSVLSMCVSNVNEAYQSVIGYCAEFAGVRLTMEDRQALYKISQDFTRIATDPALLAQLLASWQQGAMAMPDVRTQYRRMGLIATERTDEAIDADLADQGPELGTVGRDPLEPEA